MGSPTPTYSSCSLRPDQEAAGMPPGLYATLINELRDDLKDAIRAGQDCLPLKDKIGTIEPFDQNLGHEGKALSRRVGATRFELNHLQLAWYWDQTGSCLLGAANNWDIRLYVPAGSGWRNILYTNAQELEVCTQANPTCRVPRESERKHPRAPGWPDLVLHRHGSADDEEIQLLRFDGREYQYIGGCAGYYGAKPPDQCEWH